MKGRKETFLGRRSNAYAMQAYLNLVPDLMSHVVPSGMHAR
jgi:hypothetical protein